MILNVLVEQYRIKEGPFASERDDLHGAFNIPLHGSQELFVMSFGHTHNQWELVMASMEKRSPRWSEMSVVRDLFWGEDELVAQFYPSKEMCVKLPKNRIYLWKSRDEKLPAPDWDMVMPPEDDEEAEKAKASSDFAARIMS